MKISFLKIVFGLVLSLLPFVASAGSGHNLSGYAWSSNIGWISFNNTNDGGSVDYGVNKDSSGNLTGYTWSSNIGWIKFGGLSGFPSGSGTSSQNAQVVGSNLVGWAKALSADGNGWDGWISLSGTGYGVTFSGTSFTGYAWGSDVVGWVSFDVAAPSGVIVGTPPLVPVITISASPTSGTVNVVNPSLTWSATNSPTSCTATGDWSGSKATSGTSVSQGVLTTVKTYTYTLTCSNSVGSSSPTSATVVVSSTAHTTALNYSLSASRSSPQSLDGATIPPNTNVYIFTDVSPSTDVSGILFNLDTPSYSHNEGAGPYDFAGTAGDSSANPYQFTTAGSRTVTSTITYSPSGSDLLSATFTVSTPPVPVNGVCSSPQLHYTCSVGVSSNHQNFPSKVTWTCLGSDGGTDAQCSEQKGPGFKED